MRLFYKKIVKLLFFNGLAVGIFGNIFDYFRNCSQLNYEGKVRRKYDIHPSVRWANDTLIYGLGSVSIGERTYLGNNCNVVSHPQAARIIIGKNCAISHSVHIRTANYPRVPEFKEAFDMPSEWADIVIGDYCWIGAHVYINAGVVVGDNCIIGANSVVTHDIPPNSVVGGVPARLIHDKSAYMKQLPVNTQDLSR